MISIPHKAKQFLVFSIKLLIVVGALYFMYHQLASNDALDWDQFLILYRKNQSVSGIVFLLFLSFLNRYFEILKWQNLAQVVQPISIYEATKQVLAALTLGVFTPVGVGEYAGKALYFDKKDTKKIIFLNLICNGIQIVATGVFGILGMFFLGYWLWSLGTIMGVIAFVWFSYLTKKVKIKGYSLGALLEKSNEIPKPIHRKNFILGMCRYVVFSHQYYFLFLAFDVDLPYTTLMATITTVYFLASVIPSFQFLDFALKGSLAVYFFGILEVNEWVVVFVTTLMWFLNVVLPVIIGSYFVLIFKISPQFKPIND
ncbi:hypothetical protein [Flavobacterium aciduliphilum]|uniref:Lysylphosphatidylglycerol synthase-like protein n=1 Tax=Flavobacterium aciduliphilum TaxID=1101402 RepID=A0A328YEX6_9FLAO|nr:hypothetical protein [Flavobacterium aciduliphilum]RAR72469.1 hypothetical protein CLV55_10534 [Flavobacterium aciduliphilum]